MISKQVENAATLPSPDSSVSFEITPKGTQGDDHVADDEDQGHVMGDVQDSTAIERIQEVYISLVGSLLT